MKLLDQGLTARDQYTQLLSSQADLLGQVASTESQIASAKNQINEAREQIERAKSQRIEDALKELSDASNKISDGEEQIKAARSMLERTIIKAPADGIIVSLKVNSPGIVLRPGDNVLELLPTTSDLVIDARIDPRSIDTVKVGQEARLRFTALNSTTTPEVRRKRDLHFRRPAGSTRQLTSPTFRRGCASPTTCPTKSAATRSILECQSRPTFRPVTGLLRNIWSSRSLILSAARSARTRTAPQGDSR